MSKKLLGICPKCNQDISIALIKHFQRDPVRDGFDFECPNCAAGLDVEIEVQPLFWVSIPVLDVCWRCKKPMSEHRTNRVGHEVCP